METSFIPFTFALMVRLVIFLIIPIFFPSVLDYYFAGPFILLLAFLLWFAQSALLKVDYSRMMQFDKARPWYKSTSVVLCSLPSIYFASELLSTDIHFTIAFLIITALILSEQVNLYRKNFNAQTQAAQEGAFSPSSKIKPEHQYLLPEKKVAKSSSSKMRLKISTISSVFNKTRKLRSYWSTVPTTKSSNAEVFLPENHSLTKILPFSESSILIVFPLSNSIKSVFKAAFP